MLGEELAEAATVDMVYAATVSPSTNTVKQ
jgi:hypothetical protein